MLKQYNAPTALGEFKLDCPEFMYVQYMPIVIPRKDLGQKAPRTLEIPQNLEWIWDLICEISITSEDYVYVTAKHMWVEAGCNPNRPGWHIDGFGTDDVNYIWYSSSPTEFCVQEFDLSDDDSESMIQMSEQVNENNIVTYPNNTLLKLDNTVVHRVGFRTFVKISVSKSQYRLKGNAHNYLFDYNWDMLDRNVCRNNP